MEAPQALPRPLLQPHPPHFGAPTAGPRVIARRSSTGGGLGRINVAAAMAAAVEDDAFHAANSEAAAAVSLAAMLPVAHGRRWSDCGTGMGSKSNELSSKDTAGAIDAPSLPGNIYQVPPRALSNDDKALLKPFGTDGSSRGSITPDSLRHQTLRRAQSLDPISLGPSLPTASLLSQIPSPALPPVPRPTLRESTLVPLPDGVGLMRKGGRYSMDGVFPSSPALGPMGIHPIQNKARRPSLSIKLDALPMNDLSPFTPNSLTPQLPGRPSSASTVKLQPLLQPTPKTLQPLSRAPLQPLSNNVPGPLTPILAQEQSCTGKRTLYRQSSSPALPALNVVPSLPPSPASMWGLHAASPGGLPPMATSGERRPSTPFPSASILKPITPVLGRRSCPGVSAV